MPEDVIGGACIMLSVFLRDPQFQGQTKEKVSSPEASRLVETSLRDHFDHWLSATPDDAQALLAAILERTETRLKRRQEKQLKRQSPTRRARLPGKLADCSRSVAKGTEIFLVEGDSAGGSAKQARDRATQAVLPLRGKILNVASASIEKMHANQEIRDLAEALGCGIGNTYRDDDLRYERVIIMTDADVDGAHIASLLMTFFFKQMPQLIDKRPFIPGSSSAVPDDPQGDQRLCPRRRAQGRADGHGFRRSGQGGHQPLQGAGRNAPAQLRETTMDAARRTLLRVTVPHGPDDDGPNRRAIWSRP